MSSTLDDLARDLRFAARSLRRVPGFTAVVLLTLAICIGANASISGTVRAHVVLLGYDTWQRFGGAVSILGQSPTFVGEPGAFTGGVAFGEPFTIVGVMPRGFRFPSDNVQFWVPRVQRTGRRDTIAL